MVERVGRCGPQTLAMRDERVFHATRSNLYASATITAVVLSMNGFRLYHIDHPNSLWYGGCVSSFFHYTLVPLSWFGGACLSASLSGGG